MSASGFVAHAHVMNGKRQPSPSVRWHPPTQTTALTCHAAVLRSERVCVDSVSAKSKRVDRIPSKPLAVPTCVSTRVARARQPLNEDIASGFLLAFIHFVFTPKNKIRNDDVPATLLPPTWDQISWARREWSSTTASRSPFWPRAAFVALCCRSCSRYYASRRET